MSSKKAKSKKKQFELPKFKNRSKVLFFVVLFAATLLVISTYAWFSASLNVKVHFVNMKVSTDTGLFISLDGVNFDSEIEVSRESILNDVTALYPNHTNQWASGGLWTVSTIGIADSNSDKFSIFYGTVNKYRRGENKGKQYLTTTKIIEDKPGEFESFVAFDIFLKNVSGSPNSDNLYLAEDTFVTLDDEVDDETREKMSGIMNSVRIGIVRIGDTNLNATVNEIQNIQCNNNCMSLIYEPYSTNHTEKSIIDAEAYNVTIADGQYYPTYATYNEGAYLDHRSCYYDSGVAINTDYFTLQETLVDADLEEPIFQIPNGITKCRIYIWLEGQDIDSLETHSKGAPIDVSIDFIKDLAGYDEFR